MGTYLSLRRYLVSHGGALGRHTKDSTKSGRRIQPKFKVWHYFWLNPEVLGIRKLSCGTYLVKPMYWSNLFRQLPLGPNAYSARTSYPKAPVKRITPFLTRAMPPASFIPTSSKGCNFCCMVNFPAKTQSIDLNSNTKPKPMSCQLLLHPCKRKGGGRGKCKLPVLRIRIRHLLHSPLSCMPLTTLFLTPSQSLFLFAPTSPSLDNQLPAIPEHQDDFCLANQ